MNNQTATPNGSVTLTEAAVRRPAGLASQLAIEVCGFDRCGRFFTERSETCNLSDGGCKLYLRTEVERDAILALRVIERYDNRGSGAAPVLFQVTHIERESSGWKLGALKLHAEDLWPMQSEREQGERPSFD